MANLCSIEIIIPLSKVPDSKEREELTALYEAEKKWSEAVKTNDELRRGKNYHEFIASQPGVPHERTRWSNFGGSFDGRPGEVLKPDSEQWNTPTIHASFEDRDGEIWVHPYSFGRGGGLLFDENNGISFHIPKPDKDSFLYPNFTHIPMRWDFKHSFPWWAEIGFAGGVKQFAEGQDPPEGQTQEFYNKWVKEHGQPFPYLSWEQTVQQILSNLLYAIRVYENFPVSGLAWEMSWVWKELNQLRDLYKWMKKISIVSPEAIAHLDWGEVAMNSGEFKWTQENDSPNEIMSSIKRMEMDTDELNKGKLSLEAFKKKHALHLRTNEKDYRGYIPITKRDPFDYTEWL